MTADASAPILTFPSRTVDVEYDEERRVRIKGEFALSGFKVYPEFSMAIHGWNLEGSAPPPDWSHLFAVDPGRQVCAVLFMSIPPPGTADFDALLWQELYLKNCDAATFGREVARVVDAVLVGRLAVLAGHAHEAADGQEVNRIDGMVFRHFRIGDAAARATER